MLYGFNDNLQLVQYGNRSDVCKLCLKEVCQNQAWDYDSAQRRLRGKLEGKKVIKLKHSGSDIVICLEHIHKIAAENPLDEEHVIVQEGKDE